MAWLVSKVGGLVVGFSKLIGEWLVWEREVGAFLLVVLVLSEFSDAVAFVLSVC